MSSSITIDVLYETDTNGQVLRHYIYSDDNIRLAMKSGKNTVYYHYNGHGDVVALTDENGQQVASYTYDAWGNVLTSEAKTELAKSNPYGYAGYTYDAEIQQYYLMARYYHPAHGVFTSLDPDGNFAVTITIWAGLWVAVKVTAIVTAGIIAVPYVARAAKRARVRYNSWSYQRRQKVQIQRLAKPLKKENRKKQGREVNSKARTNPKFKSRSNKNPNRDMKKHIPSKRHKGGK